VYVTDVLGARGTQVVVRFCNQGRTASHPTAPSQNLGVRNYRTGLFRIARFAHGLEILRSHDTQAWSGQWEVSQQGLEASPCIAAPVAATVKPLQE